MKYTNNSQTPRARDNRLKVKGRHNEHYTHAY